MADLPYYHKELYLAAVDRNDTIIGKVERWKAHREGILHRGFTAILTIGEMVLLQHRKHLAFDDTWDLTFSSHQIYDGDAYQSDKHAIRSALTREWNLKQAIETIIPIHLGSVYYEEKDRKSVYTEHEVDHIYRVELSAIPENNPDFAYGHDMLRIEDVKKGIIPSSYQLCPWVKKLLTEISW
jgi:isopentenyldiphosphate isomerase